MPSLKHYYFKGDLSLGYTLAHTRFAILRSWRVCLECVTSKSGYAGGQYGWSVRHYPYKDSPGMLKAKDMCASFLLLFKNN